MSAELPDLNDLSTYWRDHKRNIESDLFTLVRLGKQVGASTWSILHALEVLTMMPLGHRTPNSREGTLLVIRDAIRLNSRKLDRVHPEKGLEVWRLWLDEVTRRIPTSDEDSRRLQALYVQLTYEVNKLQRYEDEL